MQLQSVRSSQLYSNKNKNKNKTKNKIKNKNKKKINTLASSAVSDYSHEDALESQYAPIHSEGQSFRTVNDEIVSLPVPSKLALSDITPKAKSKAKTKRRLGLVRLQLLRMMKMLGLVVLVAACMWIVLPRLIRGAGVLESDGFSIVCDAGSTGTRLYVFSFDSSSRLKMERGSKIKPGLSSFAHNPKGVGGYLERMFERAVKMIPLDALRNTRVYIRATAGMRLVEKTLQKELYDHIAFDAFPSFRMPFGLPREHLSTISGEDEAWYAFLAVNYLTERIGKDLQPTSTDDDGHGHDGKQLAGALDLGGKSTQIVFENRPESSGLARTKEDVYAASFLRYGTDTMLRRISRVVKSKQKNSEHLSKDGVVFNPCFFKGFSLPEYSFLTNGTGDSLSCAHIIKEVVDADQVAFAEVPEVHGEFYALSAYFYSLDAMRAMLQHYKLKHPEDAGKVADDFLAHWPRPSISEILQAIETFCTLPWAFVQDNMGSVHPLTPDFKVSHRCFEVTYVTVLLRHAYGFDVSDRKVTFTLSIKDVEVEWAIGAFLEEHATRYHTPLSLNHIRVSNSGTVVAVLICCFCIFALRRYFRKVHDTVGVFKRKTSNANSEFEEQERLVKG